MSLKDFVDNRSGTDISTNLEKQSKPKIKQLNQTFTTFGGSLNSLKNWFVFR